MTTNTIRTWPAPCREHTTIEGCPYSNLEYDTIPFLTLKPKGDYCNSCGFYLSAEQLMEALDEDSNLLNDRPDLKTLLEKIEEPKSGFRTLLDFMQLFFKYDVIDPGY